jgi:hypothetical protein
MSYNNSAHLFKKVADFQTEEYVIPVSIPGLTLLKVYDIRAQQRSEGNFDCFGRASTGYCDQCSCRHYAECLEVSRIMAGLTG